MTSHEDVELLIPWYVNGTLNEAEMDQVNGHLSGCAQCTASVEREVRCARELRRDPAGLETLARSARWGALAAGLPAPRRAARRSVPLAALVSITVVVAGAFLIAQVLQRPVYQTLTSPAAYPGPIVQVVFEPTTPERVIRSVVLDSGGMLVAGPTATGVYRIGLPPSNGGQALVERLRALPAVRWVALEAP